ncbi:ROK family protein [Tetragenococcus koreensis]|uniref:ROK family protein n=1 Tax=Tetragenococcus koreensis TaxID=290335 RepID=UPI000F4E0E40|nr:ROK family protein [Tetragenococcus koreensis]AYW46528.1 sugar kinase [Tetragenococcus koreensis]MCF1585352.1 ROK family protein [Tetragenococcus koreensis]MCF1619744.1 ROK family protein [Tetragenococcus koreensis]MCF1629595.1 ROK family protein [Tetragenococcus koreensis]MCF1657227.1 ROK family protein [Tetragenococcus koreensis]
MQIYNPTHQSESLVLEDIINYQEISRAKLTKITNLTKSSISDITKTLIDKEIIYESKVGNSTISGGRRPIYLKFNGSSALAIGIEIGRNYIKSGLSYINGKLIKEKNYVHITINQHNIIDILSQIIQQLCKNSPRTSYGIIGVGVAIHGSVYKNRITFVPYSDIDEIELQEKLSSNINLPVFLINEANASALGEYTFTSNSENLISISIQDGIGAGIVEKGTLYNGKNGNAGEIGHTTLYPDGRLCPCGNHGCLEQYASTSVLYREISQLKKIEICNLHNIAYYWYNDEEIVQLLKNNAKLLSIGINNIVSMYDPEIVVINNELYRKIPDLINIIEKHLTSRNSSNVHIQNTSLEGKTTLFGCISLVIRQFLKLNRIKFKINI